MSFFGFFTKSKIARRLVIYVLVFSSLATLLLTTYQLYRDYQYDLGLIEIKFNEIEEINKSVVEQNLWLLNKKSTKLFLEGMLKNVDIAFVEIIESDGSVFVSDGAYPDGDVLEKDIHLNYRYRNINHNLGNMKVVATLSHVYQRLWDTALIILITQAVKTFLVSIFIVFIVWQLITRHLFTIRNYALNLDFNQSQDKLELNRQENKWTIDDELALVSQAFNLMRKKLKKSYDDLEHISLHDPLTHLPNRKLLEDHLILELAQSERDGSLGALLFIDLDNFKTLNDSLGHTLADKLLQVIASRLKKAIRKGDTASRLGGDEFIIILNRLSQQSGEASKKAMSIANKIQKEINQPVTIDKSSYQITASIGVTLIGDQSDCETVMKQADNAMYQAKTQGRSQICQFHSVLQKNADIRLRLEQNLHSAIQNDEFLVHYQPKVRENGLVYSAEALIRWTRSNGESIPPGDFIQVAEETGMIVEIGYQVVSKVAVDVVANREILKNSKLEGIALNISPRQFRETDFADKIVSIIQGYELSPNLFILELTEEAVVTNISATIETMNKLKRFGFKISLDDFGIGYSSLRYLKEFPLDELKIDKYFVDHIDTSEADVAIINTIISLANNLGLQVVAEGVERMSQKDVLSKYGCDRFQGYLFSRPLESNDFFSSLSKIERLKIVDSK